MISEKNTLQTDFRGKKQAKKFLGKTISCTKKILFMTYNAEKKILHYYMTCSGKIFLTTEVWEKIITSKSPVEKVMSEYISTNSGIDHQFRLYYKLGGNASQLWVSCCSTNIQWVASGKKSAFYLLPLLFLLSAPLKIASEGSKVRVWIERGLRMSVVS